MATKSDGLANQTEQSSYRTESRNGEVVVNEINIFSM